MRRCIGVLRAQFYRFPDFALLRRTTRAAMGQLPALLSPEASGRCQIRKRSLGC